MGRGLAVGGALNVLGFEAFVALDDFVADGFAFAQGFVALALDGGMMHEDILSGFALDEAEPFAIVEPLDTSTSHKFDPDIPRLRGCSRCRL